MGGVPMGVGSGMVRVGNGTTPVSAGTVAAGGNVTGACVAAGVLAGVGEGVAGAQAASTVTKAAITKNMTGFLQKKVFLSIVNSFLANNNFNTL